jgi:hypothetical protein
LVGTRRKIFLFHFKETEKRSKGMKKGQFHSGYARGAAPIKQITCTEFGGGFVKVKCIFLFTPTSWLLVFTAHEEDIFHSDQMLLSWSNSN